MSEARLPNKKRLWEILGKERLLELGVPLWKKGCGKFWGNRGCGNKKFPVKKEAVGNSGQKEALREQAVPSEKRGCGKFWGKRRCGNKRFPVKKEAVGNSG